MSTEQSVSEALKVWDESWNEVEKTETEVEEETEEEVVAPEEVSDENAETEEVEEADESEEGEPEEAIEPPKHWSDADKKAFSDLLELGDKGKAASEFLLRRHKEMEADYTRKTQDIAPVRKVLESYKPEFEKAGLSESEGVKALGDFYKSVAPMYQNYAPIIREFETDPVSTIKKLAAQYKVDLSGTVAESDYTDPEIKALKEEITGLKSELSQHKQSGQSERLSEAQRQINTFKSETDESGNAKHPHFEELEGRIVSLLTTPGAIPHGTPQERLKAAYEQAVWTVPEYRQAFMEQQQREREEAEKQRRKEAAKQAKKAAGPKTGKSSAATPEPKTLRDELGAELERAGFK